MDNNIKIQTLSQELKALDDEDLDQISGSGDHEYVRITDEQCEVVKEHRSMFPDYFGSQCLTITNYGCVIPKIVYNEALKELLKGKESKMEESQM